MFKFIFIMLNIAISNLITGDWEIALVSFGILLATIVMIVMWHILVETTREFREEFFPKEGMRTRLQKVLDNYDNRGNV